MKGTSLLEAKQDVLASEIEISIRISCPIGKPNYGTLSLFAKRYGGCYIRRGYILPNGTAPEPSLVLCSLVTVLSRMFDTDEVKRLLTQVPTPMPGDGLSVSGWDVT